jgi:hypothetical protein
MFSIKKVRDTIISKSVIPTSSTSRLNAKLIGENLQLKKLLEKQLGPDEKLVVSADTSTSKPALSLNAKSETPETLSMERIEGRVAKMKELDAKAIESQTAYKVEKGYTRRTHGAVVLPTGAPTARIQAMIGEVNTQRMNKGQAPYKTYQEFDTAPITETAKQNADSIAKGFTYSNDAGRSPNTSNAVATYITKQKYYLLRDNGVSYILNTENKNGLLRLVKDQSMFGSDNSNSIKGDTKAHPFLNLTDAEHKDIITAQPSYEALMSVYVQANNKDNLAINIKTAISIW